MKLDLTKILWRTASGADLGGVDYEYDAIGRITARSLGVGTNSSDRAYAYDDLDRLASDGGVAYTYDAVGNRMTRTEDGATVTYTLGVGDRLASWTGGAYTHDAAGNVTRIIYRIVLPLERLSCFSHSHGQKRAWGYNLFLSLEDIRRLCNEV